MLNRIRIVGMAKSALPRDNFSRSNDEPCANRRFLRFSRDMHTEATDHLCGRAVEHIQSFGSFLIFSDLTPACPCVVQLSASLLPLPLFFIIGSLHFIKARIFSPTHTLNITVPLRFLITFSPKEHHPTMPPAITLVLALATLGGAKGVTSAIRPE